MSHSRFVGFLAAVIVTSSVGAAPPTVEDANALYNQREWPAAAEAFAKIVSVNPYDSRVWQRYGFSLHSIGRYDEAIAAFTRSMDLGFDAGACQYNIACGNALMGRTDAALDALDAAFADGWTGEDDLVHTDSDLDTIREDPRFAGIVGIPPEGLDRNAAWWFDLDYLDQRLRRVHYDLFNVMTETEYESAMTKLRRDVPRLQDYEIVVGIQRLLAQVGDGHTSLWPPHDGPYAVHEYPVRFHLFSDGLYVIAADPTFEAAVGQRVVRLGRVQGDELVDAIRPVCSVDNPMGYRAQGPRMLRIPEALAGVGIIDAPGDAELVVEDATGKTASVTLVPVPLGTAKDLIRVDTVGDNAPLYRQRTDENFWFTLLDDETTVYFQYNKVRDAADETVDACARRLEAFINEHDVDRLVIDLRHNGGGNNFLNQPLVHALIRCEKINRRGHLFVIAGRDTFSAAMNAAADIENHTEAIFAGEPTGSRPNFIGETTMVTLPCSELRMSISSLYWQRSHATDDRIWIVPEILVEPTFADHRDARDPVLEAILAYPRS